MNVMMSMKKLSLVAAFSLPVFALTGANCDGSNIVPCTEDAECSGDTPVCDQELGQCVASSKICESDAECQVVTDETADDCSDNADCDNGDRCFEDSLKNTFCIDVIDAAGDCPGSAPDFISVDDIEGGAFNTCVNGDLQCTDDGTKCG